MTELVECHSGFSYAEKPVALTWEGQRLEVSLVLAEWRTPGEKYFRVRTSDGQDFELCYSETSGDWRIQQRRGG